MLSSAESQRQRDVARKGTRQRRTSRTVCAVARAVRWRAVSGSLSSIMAALGDERWLWPRTTSSSSSSDEAMTSPVHASRCLCCFVQLRDGLLLRSVSIRCSRSRVRPLSSTLDSALSGGIFQGLTRCGETCNRPLSVRTRNASRPCPRLTPCSLHAVHPSSSRARSHQFARLGENTLCLATFL